MNSKRIILVGNGPVVTDRKAGEEIDSFDTVIRFNNFVTEGYEEYVGSRTDIWSTRICSTIGRRNPKDFGEIIGVINWCRYTQAILQLAPSFVREYPDITIIYPEQVETYSSKFGYQKNENWLSVGMITLLHLLDFGYEQVHLYGFGGNPQKHYFPLDPRDPKFHKFDLETAYINRLEEEGKVVRI